tara:strand:+ start:1618 stop:2547 length:930 start_codon:yes stop_codon:yes gene_type:complete
MKVYVVIVTFNPLQWIEKCFQSLRQSTLPLSTIVIDNNSTDGSRERIQTEYPEVDFIALETNLGFGAANNIGIKKACDEDADFIFLLNQDAWIDSDTIEKLIYVSKNNPDFGILSPLHFNGKGDGLDFWFSTYISPPRCNKYISDLIVGKKIEAIYATTMVNAAAWLLPSQTLRKIGGFNPSFFHYGEDTNYCERVLYAGFKIGVVPSAVIYHDREKRKLNIYEKDAVLTFERELVKNFSSVNQNLGITYFVLKLIGEFFQVIFKLNFSQINVITKKFGKLINLPTKKLSKNRRESLSGNFPFLSQTKY